MGIGKKMPLKLLQTITMRNQSVFVAISGAACATQTCSGVYNGFTGMPVQRLHLC